MKSVILCWCHNKTVHRRFSISSTDILAMILFSSSRGGYKNQEFFLWFHDKIFIPRCFLSVLLQSVRHHDPPPPASLTPHCCPVPDIRREVLLEIIGIVACPTSQPPPLIDVERSPKCI